MSRRTPRYVPLILTLALAAPAVPAGLEKAEKTLEYETTAAGPVLLENLIGSIRVTSRKDARAVRVEARVVAESKSAEEARQLVDSISLEPRTVAGPGVHVRFPVDRHTAYRIPAEGQGRLARWLAPLLKRDSVDASYDGAAVQLGRSKGAVALAVHLEVVLPMDLETTLLQQLGTIECDLLRGDLTIENHEGSVHVNRLFGNLTAWSAGGDLELTTVKGDDVTAQSDAGSLNLVDIDADRLTIQTTDGKIVAQTLRSDELRVNGQAGAMELDDFEARSLHVSNGSGNVELAPHFNRAREVQIESGSGDVVLHLGKVAPFDLEFRSETGEVKNRDLELVVLEQDAQRVRMRRGSGGVTLQIATASGNVQLRND